jgi:hypothetical protein
MDLVYKANVTDGLFHEHWLVKDGSPTGSTFLSSKNLIGALTQIYHQPILPSALMLIVDTSIC